MALPVSDLDALENQGYCVLEDISEARMWDIASELGSPMPETRDGQVLRLIRPQSERTSPPNTLSSRYGLSSFPFHTDAAYWLKPPRYVILRCVDPGEGNRCTLLSDTYTWLSKRKWNILTRAVCAVAGRQPFLAAIAEYDENRGFAIRYDADCMKPTSNWAKEALALISTDHSNTPVTEIHWHSGELLVIDNKRLLHARGRSSILDSSRLHQKILIGEA